MPNETPTDRAKDIFFQHISHDIRGAYLGVGSICAVIYEKVASGEEVPLRLAESLVEASWHYKYLLDQFLEFTRTKVGAVEVVEPEPFDPVEEIRQIVQLNHYLAEDRRIRVSLKVDDGFPQRVMADKWKIARIFYNVFVNALKFSPADSSVVIGFGVAGDDWTLTVTDKGKGIPAEIVERLFRERPTDNPEGPGLGLYITGYLTRLLGGGVTVQSTPGAGASFIFRFPLQSGDRF
jgi:signal transduction histidine kinase